MKVFQLNAYFSLLFIFWCFGVIFIAPYCYEILGGAAIKVAQIFYLIIAFAVYRNIWAYKNEKYAKKCFPISIGGYAIVSIAQILACFHFAGYLGGFIKPQEHAFFALIMLIPALPLGLFGFALSFYCNLKLRVPYIFYKRVEYYSLFPIYSILAISLSSYALYFISVSRDVIFKHEAISTHSAIVLAGFLILIGFLSFKKDAFFCAFISLSFAAFSYAKIVATMAFAWLHGTNFDNVKADYSIVIFHIYTILTFIFVGMILCYYAAKAESLNPSQKSPPKHKIFVVNDNVVLPITVCQKC